jgi:hypothetical protein
MCQIKLSLRSEITVRFRYIHQNHYQEAIENDRLSFTKKKLNVN